MDPLPSGKELLILDLLEQGREMYGLELVEASHNAVKRGTVYVTLGRMEEKGLVTSRQETQPEGAIGLPRRLYAPTALGLRIGGGGGCPLRPERRHGVMRRSVFSRACDTAARVCALDRTLVHAFEQIEAGAEIERARGTRWALCHAWVALARTLCVGVPAAIVVRARSQQHGAVGRLAYLRGAGCVRDGGAWHGVVPGSRPGFDLLAPWVYLISNAAGVQVVERVAVQHRAGAVAALLGMTTAWWAAALLMEVTVAVDTWPGSATLPDAWTRAAVVGRTGRLARAHSPPWLAVARPCRCRRPSRWVPHTHWRSTWSRLLFLQP